MNVVLVDSDLRSFIDVPPESHFPIQNLPYGIFRPLSGGPPRAGVAIGSFVADLATLAELDFFDHHLIRTQRPFSRSSLNGFMALGREAWVVTRRTLVDLLRDDNPVIRDDPNVRDRVLRPVRDVEVMMPVDIGDYTDFYSSREHATNVGRMFRGEENALMPNWLRLPVAYHGRASSIVPSGTPIRRPFGQIKPEDGPPQFGPTRRLDFELETGFFIGPGNPLGRRIPVEEAGDHIFGMCLVNDWSARDIQKWEYVPLGPFLGKSFATTVSPWIVPLDALWPFRCYGPGQSPEPLSYLRTTEPEAYDIHLQVMLRSPSMDEPTTLCRSNHRHLYWNMAQQLAHHTSNGCNVRPGDLLASGTISGQGAESGGSLLEIAWGGSRPYILPDGTSRTFLHDGDSVILSGWCQGDGFRVGFGTAEGTVEAAHSV